MSIVLVENTPAGEASAVATLTLAFVRDPVMRWFYPEPEAYLAHFPCFARAFGPAAIAAGSAWISDDRGGAGLWLPDRVEGDMETLGQHLFSTVDESKHETTGGMFQQMSDYHPDEPHWYLPIIGVDAAHQGKGLGSQLMKVALDRCDEDGLIAYLESSNPANVSLYQRYGFEIVGQIKQDDAPPMTPMLRPKRR